MRAGGRANVFSLFQLVNCLHLMIRQTLMQRFSLIDGNIALGPSLEEAGDFGAPLM